MNRLLAMNRFARMPKAPSATGRASRAGASRAGASRARWKPGACRRCGSRLVFMRSAKEHVHRIPTPPGYSGNVQLVWTERKWIPCQARWTYGDRHKTLVTPAGQMVPEAGPDVFGREVHFGNCRER